MNSNDGAAIFFRLLRFAAVGMLLITVFGGAWSLLSPGTRGDVGASQHIASLWWAIAAIGLICTALIGELLAEIGDHLVELRRAIDNKS